MTDPKRLHVLDSLESGEVCPNCGTDYWIVDGDGQGRFWLLCVGSMDPSCVATKPIPADVEVIDDDT